MKLKALSVVSMLPGPCLSRFMCASRRRSMNEGSFLSMKKIVTESKTFYIIIDLRIQIMNMKHSVPRINNAG